MVAVVATLLLATGCGDVEVNSKDGKASEDKSEASPTPARQGGHQHR